MISVSIVFVLGLKYLGVFSKDEFNLTGKKIVESNTNTPEVLPKQYKIEEFAANLNVPWSIVWTSKNRMLISERPGRIRLVVSGAKQDFPLISFPEVKANNEEGLMGIEVDPNYKQNRFIYACLAYPTDNIYKVKVVRLIDDGNSARIDKTIIDSIPSATFHTGCRIKFGPDQKLYITTGDASKKDLAQDINSLAGKILRINSDGSIPNDNPTANSLIYSLGHRNPQGIDWHPTSNVLFETEHGPSVFDGPAGGDEVNIIKPNQNYGWPLVSHTKHKDGLIDPVIIFTPAIAPASGVFYTSNNIPQFKNNFFFGGLIGETIIRVITTSDSDPKIISYEHLLENGEKLKYGRIRDVAMGPDGNLYFSTSNRDGRGKEKENDDKIYVIKPE